MRAKIKQEHRQLFNPFYNTVIGGVPTQVSLDDVEKNADKYINTPIGPLYENYKKVKADAKKRGPKVEFEHLDMQSADILGDIFDPKKRDAKKNEIDAYFSTQKLRREKIERKAKAKLAAKKTTRKSTTAKNAAKAAAEKKAKEAQDNA